MKGLTLLRPWAWMITHGSKRIENRSWKPSQNVIGQRIAIHAGLGIDFDGMWWLRERHMMQPAITEKARAKGVVLGTAVVTGWCTQSSDIWFTGPIGWVLSDVEMLLEPIPCRGMQGLWTVPPQVETEIASRKKVPGAVERVRAILAARSDVR